MIQEILQKAVTDAEKQQCHVTHCSTVFKVRGRGGKDSRILIISDVFISFYRVKRSPSRDRTMYWPFLTRISIKYSVIELEFGEESFRFETQETNLIIRKIISIMQRVLSKESFASLNIPSSMIYKELSANGRGTLSRFIGFCYKSGIQKIQSTFSALKQFLSQHVTTFDFSAIDVGSTIVPLMRTLCQVPFCESIIFSRLDKNDTTNIFSTLVKYGSHNLKHILIKGQIPSEFWTIISKMYQNSKIHLTGISFLDCNITEKDLYSIQQLMISKKMKSLSLQNSLLFSKLAMSYNAFFTTSLTDNLTMLNLDKTSRLNLEQLFKCIPNVYSLSLAGCELDIVDTLKFINQGKMHKLILLNLSNNHCKSKITDLPFPKLLLRLDVNGINFGPNNLSPFFEKIINNDWNDGLILSMSSIEASDSDWKHLFESMGKVKKFPLLRLTWTDNKIDNDSFYSFLSLCTRLQYLNISRCVSSNISSVFYKFNNSIVNLPLLNTIILTGHDKYPLKNALEPFLTNLINLRSLRILDISNNLIDNNTFHYVAKLLSKNVSIHTINLDGSQIDSLDPYTEIIKICLQKLTPVYISWPSNDISRLFSKNKIQFSDISNFIESLQKVRQMYYDKDSIPDTNMPLEEPFDVFKLDNINQFPNYVSDEVSEIFLKTENQANEYETVPSSPMMLSMLSSLTSSNDSILSSSFFDVKDNNSNSSAINLFASKGISKTTPKIGIQNDENPIVKQTYKSTSVLSGSSPSSASVTSNDDEDLSNDNDFDSVYVTNNNNNNSSTNNSGNVSFDNSKQRVSIPHFTPQNPNEKRKFSFDSGKKLQTNTPQHPTFHVPLLLARRRNTEKKRPESPHAVVRQNFTNKKRTSHSSLNIKDSSLQDQILAMNLNEESSANGFNSSEVTENTSSSIPKDSRKMKQVSNPIRHLPSQDELERMEADIELNEKAFGKDFNSSSTNQSIQKSSSHIPSLALKIPLKEVDDSNSFISQSPRSEQKPIITQPSQASDNQSNSGKKSFNDAFASASGESSDFDNFEWESGQKKAEKTGEPLLQLPPSKNKPKEKNKEVNESSLNQFVEDNSDDNLFSPPNSHGDLKSLTFKPLILLDDQSKSKNIAKVNNSENESKKNDPLSQFQESDENDNKDEESFDFKDGNDNSKPLLQLGNNKSKSSPQQKNEKNNNKAEKSKINDLAQFQESDEDDNDAFDIQPSNNDSKPLIQLNNNSRKSSIQSQKSDSSNKERKSSQSKADALAQFQESDESDDNNEADDDDEFEFMPGNKVVSKPLLLLNNKNSSQQKNEIEKKERKSPQSKTDILAQSQKEQGQQQLNQPSSQSGSPKKAVVYSSDDEFSSFYKKKDNNNKINNKDDNSDSDSDSDLKKTDSINSSTKEKENQQKESSSNTSSPSNRIKYNTSSQSEIETSKVKVSDSKSKLIDSEIKQNESDQSSSSHPLIVKENINLIEESKYNSDYAPSSDVVENDQTTSESNENIYTTQRNESKISKENKKGNSHNDNKRRSSNPESRKGISNFEYKRKKSDGDKTKGNINLDVRRRSSTVNLKKRNSNLDNKKGNISREDKNTKINNKKNSRNNSTSLKKKNKMDSDSYSQDYPAKANTNNQIRTDYINQSISPNISISRSSDFGFSSENSVLSNKFNTSTVDQKSKKYSKKNKVVVNKPKKGANLKSQNSNDEEGWSNGSISVSDFHSSRTKNKNSQNTDEWSNSSAESNLSKLALKSQKEDDKEYWSNNDSESLGKQINSKTYNLKLGDINQIDHDTIDDKEGWSDNESESVNKQVETDDEKKRKASKEKISTDTNDEKEGWSDNESESTSKQNETEEKKGKSSKEKISTDTNDEKEGWSDNESESANKQIKEENKKKKSNKDKISTDTNDEKEGWSDNESESASKHVKINNKKKSIKEKIEKVNIDTNDEKEGWSDNESESVGKQIENENKKKKPNKEKTEKNAKINHDTNEEKEDWSIGNDSESANKKTSEETNDSNQEKSEPTSLIIEDDKSDDWSNSSLSVVRPRKLSNLGKPEKQKRNQKALHSSDSGWGTESDFEFQQTPTKNEEKSSESPVIEVDENSSGKWSTSTSSKQDEIESEDENKSKKISQTPDLKILKPPKRNLDDFGQKNNKKNRSESYKIKYKNAEVDKRKTSDKIKLNTKSSKYEKDKETKNSYKIKKKDINDEYDEYEQERNSFKKKKNDDEKEKDRKSSYKNKRKDKSDESESENIKKSSYKIKRKELFDESDPEKEVINPLLKSKKNDDGRKCSFRNEVLKVSYKDFVKSLKNKRNSKSEELNVELRRNYSFQKKILSISSDYDEYETTSRSKNKGNIKSKNEDYKSKSMKYKNENKTRTTSLRIQQKQLLQTANRHKSLLADRSIPSKLNNLQYYSTEGSYFNSDDEYDDNSKNKIITKRDDSNDYDLSGFQMSDSSDAKTKYTKNYKLQKSNNKSSVKNKDNKKQENLSFYKQDFSYDDFGTSEDSENINQNVIAKEPVKEKNKKKNDIDDKAKNRKDSLDKEKKDKLINKNKDEEIKDDKKAKKEKKEAKESKGSKEIKTSKDAKAYKNKEDEKEKTKKNNKDKEKQEERKEKVKKANKNKNQDEILKANSKHLNNSEIEENSSQVKSKKEKDKKKKEKEKEKNKLKDIVPKEKPQKKKSKDVHQIVNIKEEEEDLNETKKKVQKDKNNKLNSNKKEQKGNESKERKKQKVLNENETNSKNKKYINDKQSSFEAEKALATAERLILNNSSVKGKSKNNKKYNDNDEKLESIDQFKTFVGTDDTNQNQLYKFDSKKKKFEWDSDSQSDLNKDKSKENKSPKSDKHQNETKNNNKEKNATKLQHSSSSSSLANEANSPKASDKETKSKKELENSNQNALKQNEINKKNDSNIDTNDKPNKNINISQQETKPQNEKVELRQNLVSQNKEIEANKQSDVKLDEEEKEKSQNLNLEASNEDDSKKSTNIPNVNENMESLSKLDADVSSSSSTASSIDSADFEATFKDIPLDITSDSLLPKDKEIEMYRSSSIESDEILMIKKDEKKPTNDVNQSTNVAKAENKQTDGQLSIEIKQNDGQIKKETDLSTGQLSIEIKQNNESEISKEQTSNEAKIINDQPSTNNQNKPAKRLSIGNAINTDIINNEALTSIHEEPKTPPSKENKVLASLNEEQKTPASGENKVLASLNEEPKTPPSGENKVLTSIHEEPKTTPSKESKVLASLNEEQKTPPSGENKVRKRRRRRKEGTTSASASASASPDAIEKQEQPKSRIPKKNRTKEDDEALHRRYSSHKEKGKSKDDEEKKEGFVETPSSHHRRHRSPTPHLHKIPRRASNSSKNRAKSTESSAVKSRTHHHHGSIPVSAKRATNNEGTIRRKLPPVPTKSNNELNETVSMILQKSSETEKLKEKKSARRSESIDNLKNENQKEEKMTKNNSRNGKGFLSSKLANSDSYEMPRLLLKEKQLSILARKSIEHDGNNPESSKPMHVTFEIDSQTLRKSKEKPKPKNLIQRPPWEEFPLKSLSKPKDSSIVAKLDNEYSLEMLLIELDAK